jgi:hypothetical protein
MVEIVAVERPSSPITGVEGEPDTAHWHNQNSVADGALLPPIEYRNRFLPKQAAAWSVRTKSLVSLNITENLAHKVPLVSLTKTSIGRG